MKYFISSKQHFICAFCDKSHKRAYKFNTTFVTNLNHQTAYIGCAFEYMANSAMIAYQYKSFMNKLTMHECFLFFATSRVSGLASTDGAIKSSKVSAGAKPPL